MQLSISDLIASIGCSVSEAQHTIESHSVKRFFGYFDAVGSPDSSGAEEQVLSPKTVKMSLPSSEDITRTCDVDIPLPALAGHRHVSLERVTVKINARLSANEGGGIVTDMGAPVMSDGAEAPDGKLGDYGEINLVFNVGDSPEGVARVVQNITKII